jgi:hypothetical protein
MCEEEGDDCIYPQDWRLIQADHIEPKAERKKRTGEEGHQLSHYMWWACIKTKEERKEVTQRSKIKKLKIINEKKRERGGCLKCERACVEGNEHLFDLDHRDENNKKIEVSRLVNRSWSYFKSQFSLELAKCDLLCCGCHMIKTFY